jgi:single-stranded DNA-binding protein
MVGLTLTLAEAPRSVGPTMVSARCYHDRGDARDWYCLVLRGGDRWRDSLPRLTVGATVVVSGRLEHRAYQHRTAGHPVLVVDVVAQSVEWLP